MSMRVLALGEVLWDLFPEGPRFGGAPANFACACAELGEDRVRVAVASAVGNDSLGEQARQQLAGHGVDVSHLHTRVEPTGQVMVSLDSERNATYRFLENPAWDHLALTPDLLADAATADAICFGTLGQRASESRQTIQRLVQASPETCLRILDINLRPPDWTAEVVLDSLKLANVLKLNEEELPILAKLLGLAGSESELLQSILSRFSLNLIAFTRGANGSRLISRTGTQSERPGVSVTVVDTVGAGDAFTASLTLGLLHNWPLASVHRWAADVAAFVCTQIGGTPTLPERYRFAHVDRQTVHAE